MDTEVETAPTTLWDIDGETLWLRRDLAETAGKARAMAWAGKHPIEVPFKDWYPHIIDISVRPVHSRDLNVYVDVTSEGHDPDFSWRRCGPDDEGAVAYWEIT